MRLLTLLLIFGVSSSVYSQETTLVDLIDIALKNNPDILASEAESRAAEFALSREKSSYRPQVNLQMDVIRSDIEAEESGQVFTSTDTLNTLSITASQTLYDKSKLENISQEERRVLLVSLQTERVKQQTMLNVIAQYFDVLRSKHQLEFASNEFEAVNQQRNRVKERSEVGLATLNEMLEIQANLDSADAQVIEAKNDINTQLQELYFLLGQEVPSIPSLHIQDMPVVEERQLAIQSLIQLAQQKNPDMLIARLAEELAKNAIKQASASKLPTLELVAGYEDTELQQFSILKTDTRYVGLQFSLPLSRGGAIRAETQEARELFVAQSEKLHRSYQLITRDINVTANVISSLASRIQAFEKLNDSAKEALRATEEGLEAGTRTILDVLNATSTVYQVKAELFSIRYEYLYNLMVLEYLTGNLNRRNLTTWFYQLRSNKIN